MKELKISIPEGIDVSVANGQVLVRGPKGQTARPTPKGVSLSVAGREITLSCVSDRRKKLSILHTWAAHFPNLFTGVTIGWEARMKIVYLHFPIKFSIEGRNIMIGNFLGEKRPRVARLVDGVTVKLDKDIVTVTGIDKEAVGNQCGIIESTTVIRNRDRRVFMDGIWLFQPPQPTSSNN